MEATIACDNRSRLDVDASKGGVGEAAVDNDDREVTRRRVPGDDAMRGAPVGLMVRACLVGLLVQLAVVCLPQSAEFSVFWALFVMYFPIIVAVNMGYQEGQALFRTRAPAHGSRDSSSKSDQGSDTPSGPSP